MSRVVWGRGGGGARRGGGEEKRRGARKGGEKQNKKEGTTLWDTAHTQGKALASEGRGPFLCSLPHMALLFALILQLSCTPAGNQ